MPNVEVCSELLSNSEKNKTYFINDKNEKQNIGKNLIIYTGNRKWVVPKTAVYRYLYFNIDIILLVVFNVIFYITILNLL